MALRWQKDTKQASVWRTQNVMKVWMNVFEAHSNYSFSVVAQAYDDVLFILLT